MKSQRRICPLIRSASVIIDSPLNTILMLTRKSRMAFAKATVFPGGVCDPEDQTASTSFIEFGKLTAIREAFQETGILLVPEGIKEGEDYARIVKRELRQSDITTEWLGRMWDGHWDELHPVLRLLTILVPLPKRFDCIFYIPSPHILKLNFGGYISLGTPLMDLTTIAINLNESKQYFWRTPQEYLLLHQSKVITLAPPQIIILNALSSIHARNLPFAKECRSIPVAVAVEPILLQYTQVADVVTLAGDNEYDQRMIEIEQPPSESKKQLLEHIGRRRGKGTRRMRLEGVECFFIADKEEQSLLRLLERPGRSKL